MAPVVTGNRIYDAIVAAAECIRQVAVAAAGNNQAVARGAEIAFYQTCLAAAQANGINFAQFAEALQELKALPFVGGGAAPPPPPAGRAHSAGFSVGFS